MSKVKLSCGKEIELKPVTLRAIIEGNKYDSEVESGAAVIAICSGLTFDDVLDLPMQDVELLQESLDMGGKEKKK